MISEFKTFILRGNVLDLAVGVLIGAAFGKIIASFTDDVLTPLITLLIGGVADFSSNYIVISGGDKLTPSMSLVAARAAGANVLAWGSFMSAIINFLILAFVIFMFVRAANRLFPPAAAKPSQTDLLTQIRDELRKK